MSVSLVAARAIEVSTVRVVSVASVNSGAEEVELPFGDATAMHNWSWLN